MLLCLLASIVTIVSTHETAFAQPVPNSESLIRVEAPPGRKKYAQTVASHATVALRQLNSQTNDALLVPVTFIVAATDKEFLQLAGGEGEQSLAVAIGSKQQVVISMQAMQKSGADKIQQVLVHELAHVYLDVKCRDFVPRWIHEGVAQMVAGEWPEAPGSGSMALSVYTGGIIPLRELVVGFPSEFSKRNQAYAESLSAVQFVVQNDHGGSLQHFLRAITGDNGRAYLRTFSDGVDLRALDNRWRESLKSPFSVLTIFLGSGFFWGFAALLVIVAYFVRRRKSKVIREEWAAEDAIYVDLDGIEVDDPDDLFIEGDGEDWKKGQY